MESKAEMRITTGTAKTPVEPHTAGRNVMAQLYRIGIWVWTEPWMGQ
jgi:hypothetical protein